MKTHPKTKLLLLLTAALVIGSAWAVFSLGNDRNMNAESPADTAPALERMDAPALLRQLTAGSGSGAKRPQLAETAWQEDSWTTEPAEQPVARQGTGEGPRPDDAHNFKEEAGGDVYPADERWSPDGAANHHSATEFAGEPIVVLFPVPPSRSAFVAPAPAVLSLSEAALAEMSPVERELMETLYNDFVDEFGNTEVDPADPVYLRQWNSAVSEADRKFRLHFGHTAWVQMSLQAGHLVNEY